MLSQKNLREMQRKLSKYFLSTAIAQVGILSVVCVFSFYSEIGLVWISWVTIAFLFLGGVVGFLLYNLDSRVSIRIWRFLRKHRKAWKWIKDHKLDAKVPWNTSEEDVWEGGVDYKFDQMHDVIQFVKWLASRQFLLGSFFTAVFEELIFRGLLIFVLVFAFRSLVLAIVLCARASCSAGRASGRVRSCWFAQQLLCQSVWRPEEACIDCSSSCGQSRHYLLG
jgi:hypothetical protein